MDVMTTTNANTIGRDVTRAEVETPPRIVAASLPFTNGVLKRHKQQNMVVGGVVYKECLKNHAASMGGHALDGCGEFMPAQTATATDPRTLKCAACGCHRNFHRLERVSAALPGGARVVEYHPQHRHLPLPPPGLGQTQAVTACQVRSPESDNDSPPPISSTYYPGSAPHMLLALSSGGGTATTTPTPTNNNNNETDINKSITIPDQIFGSRKRFRTKFTQEQKDRMQEFAEKVGWKMQKSTSDLINGFCDEIGVHREVFKVWMHNNKNTLGKRSAANYVISPNLNHNQAGISLENNINNNDNDNENEHVNGNENGNGVGNSHSSSINNTNNSISHHLTNASSSSS